MKRKNQKLNKNISRLVKQAGDSDKPNKAFKDSLTQEAMKQLKQPQSNLSRGRKDTIMSVKKILAIAASIVIVCGLTLILLPSLSKTRHYSMETKIKTDEYRKKIANQLQEAERVVTSVKEKPSLLGDQPFIAGNKSDSIAAAKPELLFCQSPQPKAPAPGDKYFCYGVEPAPQIPPMAHGGTTPPNDEDIDAQFFKNYGVNPFVDTEDDHLSTFATDVDTGSYTIARKYLHDGHVPPSEAVRVEEFVNYFKYDYPAPQEDDFAVYTEACPWQFGEGRKNSYLMRVALKAKQIDNENRKPAILTFVIDVSGSMKRENRLGLVKKLLTMLVNNLRPDDMIGIAVYGSQGRKVMDHKSVSEKQQILDTIESLHSGGSTYAEQGIRIGYQMADAAYKKGYINRVILCSDGVANVGKTGADSIYKEIKAKADKGITLSAIGFGMGNYNDVLMEQLGNKGNGYYAYIDTIAQAKKLFAENLTGTLQVVARDVKIQVDFNPEVVRSYRLIGYENRDVPDDKFRDDTYDGGEMGAGHSATALYELKLWPEKKGPIATTYVRYKDADTFAVTEFKSKFETTNIIESIDKCGRNFRLSATVSEFAEILRKSYWAKGVTLDAVLEHAQTLPTEFAGDADVIELVDLISKAKNLTKDTTPSEYPEDIEYIEQHIEP